MKWIQQRWWSHFRNVAIRVHTNNKRMKSYMPLPDTEFKIGPYNDNDVELTFYQIR